MRSSGTGYRVLDLKAETRAERVALLMIKVKLGIRVKRNRRGEGEVARAHEREGRENLAISEMAAKINEWKSSLSSSRRDAPV